MSKLITVIGSEPLCGNPTVVRGNKEPDWVMEAINAPVGKVAQALMNDPRKSDSNNGNGFSADWLRYLDQLIGFKGDLRRHALVIFAHNTNWFYAIDPIWTEANMLAVLDKDDESDRFAIWNGFFWGAKVPNSKLYMRLKTHLLALAIRRSLQKHIYTEVLAGLILAGWGSHHEETGDRYLSNTEMHDVLLATDEEFRSSILWQVERWSQSEESGMGEKWSVMLLELMRDVWPVIMAKTQGSCSFMCPCFFKRLTLSKDGRNCSSSSDTYR
jgi:hypothetical protein